MAVAITYLERYEPLPRNTVTLFDRFGKPVLTYAKVHTCDFDVEQHLTPGDEFPVAELDTAAGPVKVGAMICYDREFPESARILMLQGGGNPSGAQRLPDGGESSVPAAGQGVRKHGGNRHV